MDSQCRFPPLSGPGRGQKEIKNGAHLKNSHFLIRSERCSTPPPPAKAGGNVIQAAGERRSAPGWRADRAPCRMPRGAPRSLAPAPLRSPLLPDVTAAGRREQTPAAALCTAPRSASRRSRGRVGGGRAGDDAEPATCLPSLLLWPEPPLRGFPRRRTAHPHLVKEEPRPEKHAARMKGRTPLLDGTWQAL